MFKVYHPPRVKLMFKVYGPPRVELIPSVGTAVEVSVVCVVRADTAASCTVDAALPRWPLHSHVHIMSAFYQTTFITTNTEMIVLLHGLCL